MLYRDNVHAAKVEYPTPGSRSLTQMYIHFAVVIGFLKNCQNLSEVENPQVSNIALMEGMYQ